MKEDIVNKLKSNRGDVLGGSVGKIAAIFLAVILMFIFPLMEISQRNDDVSQTAAQAATVKFVDKVASQEKITAGDYDSFIAEINATGNTFEVTMEHKILDVNNAPGKKGVSTSKIGENLYYSVFTSDILAKLNSSDSAYNLNPGDMISIDIHNSNRTISSMFVQMISGGQEGAYKIQVSYSAMVK